MNKKSLIITVIVMILIIFVVLFTLVKTNIVTLNNEPKDSIEHILNEMTLEEKIGQMIIMSYRNPTVDSTLENTLKTVKPGGFILFKENITTYENTINFIQTVKKSNDIPLWIGIDQEGGNVQRLKALEDHPVSDIPYMNAIGQTNNIDYARQIGKVMAEELKVFGINMDFAPDIDIWTNPDNTVIGKRSFGSNPTLVSQMGIALGDTLLQHQIVPVYKHFPGHGNTAEDSHYVLPVVTKTLDELLSSDLIPFQDAIAHNVPIIMVGHLAIPNITNDNTPASLSKVMIHDILKEQLGYKGLVVTDALDMGALTQNYTEEEIYTMAINAGVDLLLMPQESKNCVKIVADAVKSGKISESQIDESVRKILKLKYDTIADTYNQYAPIDILNSAEHQAIITQIKESQP